MFKMRVVTSDLWEQQILAYSSWTELRSQPASLNFNSLHHMPYILEMCKCNMLDVGSILSRPRSVDGLVGRTVRTRGKTERAGGILRFGRGLWANARGCPGSKYMHYILENGSTNGRNYSMTLKMGLGYKALERVNRAARARFATGLLNKGLR
jgi:hypothetical protein